MDGITAYALSKKVAASAVSGVQSMSVSGQTLTINTKDSGVLTMTFPTPKDGVSVTDIDVNANNQIVFTMSDGTEIISGKIPTVKGDPFKYSDFTQEQLDALKGDAGVSPTITENAGNTDKIYKLDITTADSTFTTPNLKGADGQGGTGSGEENVIESIKVNGVVQTVADDKSVDITVPTVDVNKNYVDTELAKKANSSDIPSLDGYAKTSEIPSKVSELENDSNYLSSIPEEYVTETELSAKGYLTEHQDISGKVDKVEGKSLISDTEIERLASVNNYDDTDIRTELANKADATAIPSKVSELTNDSNYQTAEQVNSTVTTEIAKVVADAPEDLNTLKEMSDWIAGHENDASAMNSAISDNKTAITALQTGKADKSEIPTTVSELTDSADYAKTADIPTTLPANGGNADTVNGHTVGIDVPSDAKFTDTTYSDATQIEHGLMSVDDKKKLDGLKKYTPDGSTITADEDGTLHGVTVDDALSPTSTNPVQNKVVTSNLTDIRKETTVNLLNPTLQTSTLNGVTCTNNGDGTYTFNGTATKDVFFDINNNIPINKGTKYKIISFKDEDYVPNKIMTGLRKIDTVDTYVDNNGSFVADSKNCWLWVKINKGFTVPNLVAKPMLTTNLSATYDDFVPYTGDGETLASDVAEIKNDLGGLSFSASGTTLTITDGTNTWTLGANS